MSQGWRGLSEPLSCLIDRPGAAMVAHVQRSGVRFQKKVADAVERAGPGRVDLGGLP